MAMNRYKMYISAFGGMDGLMRIVNILRRGKVHYNQLHARFSDGNRVEITIYLEGESKEVRWVAAKLDRLPETYTVKVEPPEDELSEATAAAIRG